MKSALFVASAPATTRLKRRIAPRTSTCQSNHGVCQERAACNLSFQGLARRRRRAGDGRRAQRPRRRGKETGGRGARAHALVRAAGGQGQGSCKVRARRPEYSCIPSFLRRRRAACAATDFVGPRPRRATASRQSRPSTGCVARGSRRGGSGGADAPLPEPGRSFLAFSRRATSRSFGEIGRAPYRRDDSTKRALFIGSRRSPRPRRRRRRRRRLAARPVVSS